LHEHSPRRIAGRPAIALRAITSPTDPRIEDARALFVEYAASLGVDLSFQGFEEELRAFPAGYLPPHGALVLASCDEEPAGCVAMRDLAGGSCEMKRLYVRPAWRGLGLGESLARAVIRAAREAGYDRMRLDTLPGMGAARALYRSLGFTEIAPYYHNPISGTAYMERSLRDEE